MNVKDIIELEITGGGMNGEGVARLDGKVVFVPYTLEGERVRAVVRTVKKNYAEASVIKILSASPSRVLPPCPHYFRCGGCDALHLSADYRKASLLAELKNNFKKIAGIDYTPTEFVSTSDVRNKTALPFGKSAQGVILGMYRRGTHIVEPVECMFAGAVTKHICKAVVEFAAEKKLEAYDAASGSGLLRHLVVREVPGAERVSATLVINAQTLGARLETELAGRLPDSVDFFICPNTKRNNVILGDTVRLVKGEPRLKVNVLGVFAELSPLSFFQVNGEIRDRIYKEALESSKSDMLVDLYSGIGITSNLAANAGKTVRAVECVPQAVKDADATARLNGNADSIENRLGDVEKVLPTLGVKGNCDVLVDPPRKGCGGAVMTSIADIAPDRLVYISCNHATMCRDIAIFSAATDNAYEIGSCKLFDMFPGTHHVETLLVLKKK